MQNLGTTLKYQYMLDAQHEFISSVGVTRTWGDTGSAAIANQYGSTEPTFYFGKGLGDLPIGLLRPLAITGTLGTQFPRCRIRRCKNSGCRIGHRVFNSVSSGSGTGFCSAGLDIPPGTAHRDYKLHSPRQEQRGSDNRHSRAGNNIFFEGLATKCRSIAIRNRWHVYG
jgi:hypothetical protein